MDLPDTINDPKKFVNSAPAGFDGVFDWRWMVGCFGKASITPMDLDALIERNGHFLVLETKEVGVPIPYGQLLTLKQLYRLGCFTVLFIQGKGIPEFAKVWCEPGFHDGLKQPRFKEVDVMKCREFVRQWWRYADKESS